MKQSPLIFLLIGLLTLILAACNSGGVAEDAATESVAVAPASTDVPATEMPTETAPPPTETATATALPPTETPIPPTATALPPTETATPSATPLPAYLLEQEITAADGCPIVTFNEAAWGPLFNQFKGGGDSFFHIHTMEDAFWFNIELYTQYGAGWTGQMGSFAPDCNGNGICVYFAESGGDPYLATAGEVTINELSQIEGSIQYPVEIALSNLTLNPVPGTNGTGCVHIDSVTVTIED